MLLAFNNATGMSIMKYISLSIQEIGRPKLNGHTKIRVRSVDGTMQIRPTGRTKGKLPDDEFLVSLDPDIDNTLQGVILPIFNNVVDLGNYLLVKDKYGWFTLVQCEDGDLIIYLKQIGE